MAAVPNSGGKEPSKPDAAGGAVDGLTPPTMKYAAEAQQTQIGPPQTMAQPPQSITNKPRNMNQTLGGPGGGETMVSDVGLQDLSSEKLLRDAPRMETNGKMVPSLNGIPLMAKLGQGGMGAVYYGVHPRLRSEVAVKVLPFHLAEQDPGMIRRFFREAQIAAQVRSPHLVNVMDVNEESGLFFLVMEYVPGCTAGQYLKARLEKNLGGVTEVDALDIICGATEGLLAAHQQGIVHRDLKPDNIMIPYLSRSNKTYDLKRSKLMDLGLARSEENNNQSLTGVQAAMGTPGYMAPEQAMDAKTAGKPADIFGMGATIYALLSGRPPFRGEAVMKVLMATMHEPHEPITKHRPDVSQQFSDIIDRCLDKKQENRFADAQQLLRALKACRRLVAPSAANSGEFEGEPGEGRDDAAVLSAVRVGGGGAKTMSPAAKTMTPAAKTFMANGDIEATMLQQQNVAIPAEAPKKNTGMLVGVGVAVLALAVGGAYMVLGSGKTPTEKDPGKKDPVVKNSIDPKQIEFQRKKFQSGFEAASKMTEKLELEDKINDLEGILGKLPPDEAAKLKSDLEKARAFVPLLEKRNKFQETFGLAKKNFMEGQYPNARKILNGDIEPVTSDDKKFVDDLKKQVNERIIFQDALKEAAREPALEAAGLQLDKLAKVKELAVSEDDKKKYDEREKFLSALSQYNDFLTKAKAANDLTQAQDFNDKAYKLLPDRSEAKEFGLELEGRMGEQAKIENQKKKKKEFVDSWDASTKALGVKDFDEAKKLATRALDSAPDDKKETINKLLAEIEAGRLADTNAKHQEKLAQLTTDATTALANESDFDVVRGKIFSAKDYDAASEEVKILLKKVEDFDKARADGKAALEAKPKRLEDADAAIKAIAAIAPKSIEIGKLATSINRARESLAAEGDQKAYNDNVQSFNKFIKDGEPDKAKQAMDLALSYSKVTESARKELNEKYNNLKSEIARNSAYITTGTTVLSNIKDKKWKDAAAAITDLNTRFPNRELADLALEISAKQDIEAVLQRAAPTMRDLEPRMATLLKDKKNLPLNALGSADSDFKQMLNDLDRLPRAKPELAAMLTRMRQFEPTSGDLMKYVKFAEDLLKQPAEVKPPPATTDNPKPPKNTSSGGSVGETDIEDKKDKKKTPPPKDKPKSSSGGSVGENNVDDK